MAANRAVNSATENSVLKTDKINGASGMAQTPQARQASGLKMEQRYDWRGCILVSDGLRRTRR
jgi:hypothetical protein